MIPGWCRVATAAKYLEVSERTLRKLIARREIPFTRMPSGSIRMTVDIYGHLIPGSNRDAVNRLDSTQPNATQTQPQKSNGL